MAQNPTSKISIFMRLQLPLHAVGSQVKSWTLSILTYVWHNDAEAFSALLCQKDEARKMKRLKMKIRRLFSPSILPFVCDPTKIRRKPFRF